jgi:hypothetical protein
MVTLHVSFRKLKNLFFALVVLCIVLACEKEKEVAEIIDIYRISEVVYDFTNDDYDSKIGFSYEGPKLIQMIFSSKNGLGNWYEYSKRDITYTDEKATETYSSLQNITWIPDYQVAYTFADELVIFEDARAFINNTWVVDVRNSYTYLGKNLTHWSHVADDGMTSGDIFYKNGKMSQAFSYDCNGDIDPVNWEFESRDSCGYKNDSLTSFTHFIYDAGCWEYYSRNDLTYSSGKVSHIERYNWIDNQWSYDDQNYFTYDNNGLLILDQNDTYTISYQYEKGNGNAQLFFYYPMELLNGEPYLKSTGLQVRNHFIPLFKRLQHHLP